MKVRRVIRLLLMTHLLIGFYGSFAKASFLKSYLSYGLVKSLSFLEKKMSSSLSSWLKLMVSFVAATPHCVKM